MTCSPCHLFNSCAGSTTFGLSTGWTAGQAWLGDVPLLTATHEHSPSETGPVEPGEEGTRGARSPLPAACDELIHHLSHQ